MLDMSGTLDAAVAAEALAGLGRSPKTLPAKLFYDAKGCALFDAITRLPEYYPTRTELALLHATVPAIARRVPPRSVLVEYGASSEDKAEILLEWLQAPAAYVPIDVAAAALAALRRRMQARLPVHPLVADFLRPLVLPREVAGHPVFGFFPGSTIGNLEPDVAICFLQQVRDTLGAGALFLVGVDLRKDPAVLIPAYDDAAGVTAAFNLNLLARLNREAGAAFDLSSFVHDARWNEQEGRIEMHLVSLRAQTVRVAGHSVRFEAGESIHTENSYKHTVGGFIALAARAGWRSAGLWRDAAGLFSLHLLTTEDRDEA
ncbi:Histidine N-alpha-methyltransferase [Rhodovastum atsumiense]|uniref:L-histidine N(Alpha)-methyltransferase n=1 Tax=Rhodovastum atsumiense TaxID=504468 RepID=A0A5M6IYI6_9PROT|nr:L-histidine N(alpha)-methyltransferase [Rhodovastum atsumiense]KAA5613009.1 L-histidine N(alpha)-methyltransferase [Rhodovastum atsumiense]CAH2600139.1 Histidine N-alpha-methyltransferase [Rhodovastum atsumiense]